MRRKDPAAKWKRHLASEIKKNREAEARNAQRRARQPHTYRNLPPAIGDIFRSWTGQ